MRTRYVKLSSCIDGDKMQNARSEPCRISIDHMIHREESLFQRNPCWRSRFVSKIARRPSKRRRSCEKLGNQQCLYLQLHLTTSHINSIQYRPRTLNELQVLTAKGWKFCPVCRGVHKSTFPCLVAASRVSAVCTGEKLKKDTASVVDTKGISKTSFSYAEMNALGDREAF